MDGRIAVTRVEDDCTNLVGECVAIQFRDFCLDEDNDPGARPPVVTNAVVTIRNFSGSVIPAAGGGFYNLTGGRIQTLDAGVIETANPDGSTDEELFGWKICEDPVSGCKWWSLETCALPANKHTGVEPDDPDYAALPTQGTYYRLSAQIAGRNVVINFEIDAGLDYSAEYRCECIPIEIVSIDEETLPVDQSDIWCLRVESCLTFLADGPGQVIKDPDNPGTWLIQFADHQSSDDSVAVSYDAAGNVWDHSISLTSDSPHLKIVQGANPGEWVFTDEDATLRDNGDGTFTWVNPDGTDGSTWSTSGSVRDNGDGTYTWVLPDGTDGDTWEGDGEVVDNGDGTFTWQGADGTAGSTWSTSGTVRDNGDGTFTWVLPDGTDGDTWEGRGDVVDNGDGTFSYLDANGAVVATWRADDDATVVTNPDGSLSYVDSDGNVLNTWHSGAGSVVDNGDGTFSWVTPGNVVVSTWTTDDDGNVVDNGDGTFSYLDADGNVVQTWFDGYRIEPDAAGGSWTVSRPDGTTYQITDDEFDESLVDNGDGSYTFTDDDGSTVTIAGPPDVCAELAAFPQTGDVAEAGDMLVTVGADGSCKLTAAASDVESGSDSLTAADGVVQQKARVCSYPEGSDIAERHWTADGSAVTHPDQTYYPPIEYAFSGVDAEGYPEHANAPDSTGTINTSVMTNPVGGNGNDQGQVDGFIRHEGGPLWVRTAGQTSAAAWIGGCCDAQMTKVWERVNDDSTGQIYYRLGDFPAGTYRFRLYTYDPHSGGIAALEHGPDEANAERFRVSHDNLFAVCPEMTTRPVVVGLSGDMFEDDGVTPLVLEDGERVVDWFDECAPPCGSVPAASGAITYSELLAYDRGLIVPFVDSGDGCTPADITDGPTGLVATTISPAGDHWEWDGAAWTLMSVAAHNGPVALPSVIVPFDTNSAASTSLTHNDLIALGTGVHEISCVDETITNDDCVPWKVEMLATANFQTVNLAPGAFFWMQLQPGVGNTYPTVGIGVHAIDHRPGSANDPTFNSHESVALQGAGNSTLLNPGQSFRMKICAVAQMLVAYPTTMAPGILASSNAAGFNNLHVNRSITRLKP